MTTIIVAVYHTINDTDAVRAALAAEGVAPGDMRISDYIDPVVKNAPGSIEKPGGFLYWLGGIPKVDVEAYREAIARGRTIVAARVADAHASRVEAVLERFDPLDIGGTATMQGALRRYALADETR